MPVADGASPAYMTARLEAWRRWTDGPLLVLAIGTLPMLLLEVRRGELHDGDVHLVDVVNIVVLVAFAIDYVVELALASNRRSYVRHEWASLLIVASQALAIAPGLRGFGVTRAARGARAMRFFVVLFRVVAIGGATAREGRTYLRRHAATLALGAAGLTWLTAASAFVLAEGVQADGDLYPFEDALWWATATITTVGYGDIYPVTRAGRLVAAFTMVVGISTFAVVTAKVAEFLSRTERPRDAAQAD